MIRNGTILLLAAFALVLAGCGPEPEEAPSPGDHPASDDHPPAEPGAAAASATARLIAADAAAGVSGDVQFTQEAGGVRIAVSITGLEPGQHAIHIHENGVCEPPFDSAGGHLNPYGLDHGCAPAPVRHLGDLGNLEVGADGRTHFDQVVDKISLVDPHHQIAGKTVIVHADPDDCTSQPTGASGARVACGVIEAAGGSPDEGAASDEGAAASHEPM